jgi:hypothetical protein
MYELILLIHSWLRWGALVAGFVATFAAFGIRPGESSYPADRWGLIFTITLDIQFLLGFLLYFALSPATAAAFDNFGAAMKDPVARFWAVEHGLFMVFAVLVAHVGRVLAKKTRTPPGKRVRLVTCFALATIAMLVATPWPGLPAGRPLFRF